MIVLDGFGMAMTLQKSDFISSIPNECKRLSFSFNCIYLGIHHLGVLFELLEGFEKCVGDKTMES